MNILYVTRDESRWVFRGPHHFRQELARAAQVTFWQESGSIVKILAQLPMRPDFIMLHMQPLNEAPSIEDLDRISIPIGIYVEDVHYRSADLRRFIEENDVRFVFCPYREHFHRYLHQMADRFRWLPHCIDPAIYRDYQLPKTIDRLMMGQVVAMYYPFRQAVLQAFSNCDDFVYHGHPGYVDVKDDDPRAYVGGRYAQELNRAELFFTCGSKWNIPVAKYFEAPACRAVVMAPGGADFPDLGFIDGETFVACTLSDFEEKARHYLEQERERERVAQNGHTLVLTRHSVQVRVREFLEILAQADGL